MFFIPKLLLIILLSKTYAQNIETTLLPAWHPTDSKEIALTLKVFGKQIQLNLRKNDHIVSSTLKTWKHDAKDKTEEQFQLNASDSCYYHHRDHISSAVINFCHKYGLEGVIFLEDVTLEIVPLQSDVISSSSSLISNSCLEKDINVSFGKSHLIKKSLQLFANTSFYHLDYFKRKQRHVPPNMEQRLYIELAVFVDEPAYRTFMPFLNNNHTMLTDLIITYVHGIQALFHHPSLLGVSFEISLTHLDIFQKQPPDLPYFVGDDIKLLDSFCNYAKIHNPLDDDHPHHWDIGIYLTGLDIYRSSPTGGRDFSILGLSRGNTICKFETFCPVAVVEFGVFYSMRTDFELTGGFASIYVAVHEIGHILGMSHDDDSENDRDVQPIMTSNYLNKAKLKGWSWKSRNEAQLLKGIDCLQDQPDPILSYKYKRLFRDNFMQRKWKTAKKQCELFFRDRNADVVTLHNACMSLQCKTLSQVESYFTGPALHGTPCAPGKECLFGECISVNTSKKLYINEESSWAAWIMDSCKSHCLEKSKGVIVRRRYCQYWNDMTKHCIGSSYDVVLCNDSMLCNKKRKTIKEYINEQCDVYSHLKPEFKALLAKGRRLPYKVETPWQACTIYCQVKDRKNYYYLPRVTINGTNIDGYPYLPDGTWCHAKNGQNYYCRTYYCLPEN